jgi:hypothetical protein
VCWAILLSQIPPIIQLERVKKSFN